MLKGMGIPQESANVRRVWSIVMRPNSGLKSANNYINPSNLSKYISPIVCVAYHVVYVDWDI